MATLQQLGTVRLRLRLGGEDYQETLHAVQGDTGRVLEFDVLDGDGTVVTDLTGVTPVLFVRKPDGKEVGSATGEIVGGVIRITIPSSLLAYAGETKAQIQLVDSVNQHKLHDHLYRLQIEESLEAGASPGENLWFSLAELTEAIAEVNLLVEQYDTDVAAVATMRDDVTTKHGEVTTMHASLQSVFDSEQARKTAESGRVSAENARKTAETARASSWSTLKNYWDTKIKPFWDNTITPAWTSMAATWDSWSETWTGWVSAENTRKSNENTRVSNENTRKTNEQGRVSNETARIQQWQTWEGLIEEGAMPNATSTTAGAVKVDALGTESAPYTAVTTGKLASDLTGKVDKISGKGLSTHDYTEEAKAKVDSAKLINHPIEITQGQDMNALQAPGFYKAPNSAIAVSLENSPTNVAFGMMILDNLPCTQMVFEYGNGNTRAFIRELYGFADTWSAWREILFKSNADAYYLSKTSQAADAAKLGGHLPAYYLYTHPESHPASMITQDSARRMVSDTQITSWTNKVDKSGGQMTGALIAKSSGDARQVRNIAIGTAAPTSTTGHTEGDIWLVVP